MYRFHNVGLYCHYAAIGVGYGIAGISLNCESIPTPVAPRAGGAPARGCSLRLPLAAASLLLPLRRQRQRVRQRPLARVPCVGV